MILNSTSSISCLNSISAKAINITRSSAGVNNISSLTANTVRLVSFKSSVLNTSLVTANSKKAIYLKPNIVSSSTLSGKSQKYQTSKVYVSNRSGFECYSFNRDLQKELKRYLPIFIRNSSIFNSVLNSQGNELTRLHSLLEDLVSQFYANTTTWGLDIWESILNIDSSDKDTLESRKNRIKFRLQNNASTVTKALFKEIMDSYYECSIDEDFDNSKINITVLGARGIPEKLQSMDKDASIFIPAHLLYEFIFTYLPWSELDSALLTWDKAETYNWNGIESAFLKR